MQFAENLTAKTDVTPLFSRFKINASRKLNCSHHVFIITMLLLGRSRSGAPFRDVFSIPVALFVGVVLQLSNILQEEVRQGW